MGALDYMFIGSCILFVIISIWEILSGTKTDDITRMGNQEKDNDKRDPS